MDQILLDQIKALRLVPVIRIEKPQQAVPLGRALRDGGLPCAEVTFRTDCAAEAIRKMLRAYPDMLVGAGTVLTRTQVDQAIAAGAKFVVSPGLNPDIVRYCQQKGIPVIPGCSTPSDVEQALALGLTAVKFFPAEFAGGLAMIQAMSAPYGQVQFMPTGGIHEKNIRSYLDNPRVLACGGSWMVSKELLEREDYDTITKLTRRAVRLVQDGPAPAPGRTGCSDIGALFPSGRKYDTAVLGEPLIRYTPADGTRIAESTLLRRHAGGAELNVAAGLSGLGLQSALLSKLPCGPAGEFLRGSGRRCGVSMEYLIGDDSPSARAGAYYYEPASAPRKPSVIYDRKHSSFTTFSAEELPEAAYTSARLFYTSGISLAVSQETCTEVTECMRRFKEQGTAIAFDVNFRAGLWSESEAREAITRILPLVDILFVSEETCRRMFGKAGTLEEMMKSFREEFGIPVVISSMRTVNSPKNHAFGAVGYCAPDGLFAAAKPYKSIEVADRIGSGDSFVAGVLYALLQGGGLPEALDFGCAMAAHKITVEGDLPSVTLPELETMVREHLEGGAVSEMNR